ncbi:MAG: hypothetical protein ACXWQO_02540 [Bdellovibrionota bacterium]
MPARLQNENALTAAEVAEWLGLYFTAFEIGVWLAFLQVYRVNYLHGTIEPFYGAAHF